MRSNALHPPRVAASGYSASWRNWLRQRFESWLNKRMPAAQKHQLSRHNIFIFPTRFGFVYLVFDFILFLLATNYQNNLIMLLSFLLGSLFITSMLHSFYNLSGLNIAAVASDIEPTAYDGFVGDTVAIPLQLSSAGTKYALMLAFEQQGSCQIDELKDKPLRICVPFVPSQRGVQNLPRVNVSSTFALGLFTTWTRLDFGIEVIAYPQPQKFSAAIPMRHQPVTADDNGQVEQGTRGQEDFYQLNSYQRGEPLSGVAWKQLARGQGWWSKAYQDPLSGELWLCLDDMPSQDLEQKLQFLSYLVLEHERLGKVFGLDLAGARIAADAGKQHCQQCLRALAMFGSK